MKLALRILATIGLFVVAAVIGCTTTVSFTAAVQLSAGLTWALLRLWPERDLDAV